MVHLIIFSRLLARGNDRELQGYFLSGSKLDNLAFGFVKFHRFGVAVRQVVLRLPKGTTIR
jgi:hypothetical protein